MDRPATSDAFFRKAEERRRALAAQAGADPRERLQEVSGSRHPVPPRAAATARGHGVLLLAALAAVVLVACAVSAVAVVVGGSLLQSALNSPTSTVQNFYSALQQSDYTSAYKLFSSAAQAHLSSPAFADQFGAYDSIDGRVTQVSIGTPQYKSNGDIALVTVSVTRAGSGARVQMDQLVLIKEQGSWRIQSISLQFTSDTTSADSQ